MKKRVHKNQIVITTLAVLIAVAGYVTYDKKGADIKDAETVANMNQGAVSDQADKDYETGEDLDITSSKEMQIKIIRAKDAIASQKPRTVRCPYCRHNSIIVFEDTRGHVQTKCKACGRETVFNVLEMRRLRRLQLYYSSLNG